MALVKNEAQEKAIATIDGPVIIISCPGSGKTTTLVRRIKNIVDHDVDPSKILMVTFANDAAKEMGEKYKEMYSKNPGVVFSTIHALCLNILREEKGYDRDNIIQERRKIEFFNDILKYNPQVNDSWELSKQIITEISNIKNNYINFRTYNSEYVEKNYFLELYLSYEKYKKQNSLIDFDDMIIEALQLLKDDKGVREKWQNKFDYIQCDEYQDTNKIQRDILYILSEKHKNLCVVGDDDQSIYKFRGADFSIMLNFDKDFKDVAKINMSTNYRSTKDIVNIANLCIQKNTVRFDKDFVSFRGKEKGENGTVLYSLRRDKSEEIGALIQKIEDRHKSGVAYKDMAVLFRTNKQANPIVEALERKNIPYNSSEKINSVFDNWIFDDIKAYIELGMGINTDYNLQRIINHPNRFLQSKRFKGIEYSMRGLRHAMRYMERQGAPRWQQEAAEESLEVLYKNFGIGKIKSTSSPAVVFQGLDAVKYIKYLEASAEFRKEDKEVYIEEYNYLKNIALQFKTVGNFLDYVKKDLFLAKSRNKKKDENGIAIMTMHSSKGLEWDSVFLSGVSQGLVPSARAKTKEDIEEERRIFYVAMTRAKDYLYITGSGRESEFMTKIIVDMKEEKDPTIKKKLAGSKVFHKEHGEGKVVNYTKDKIRIRYKGGGILEYPFPEIFKDKTMKYI